MTVSERFLNYVSYPTMSDDKSDSAPSTKKQLVLARALCDELNAIGVVARMDEYGYVYGKLEANTKKPVPCIGLIAHMDTSNAAADAVIRPRVVDYRGGDILLNEEKGIVLSPADYEGLRRYEGEKLIVTDGTTLLGADDKAGIAEIITALEMLIRSGAEHGAVAVAFTPDEEIGRGTDHFDLARFGADFAYTVDGGTLGEIEFECFNAATAVLTFCGVSIHPGSAKEKMKNALKMAMVFDSLLPAMEVPEHTEGYEGFYHLCELSGDVEDARAEYIVRDHSRTRFEERKTLMRHAAAEVERRFGKGTVGLTITDTYYNMREIIEQHYELIDRADAAMRAEGITPMHTPIRGGTDGARLSFDGLPCPNLSTGGENFHSRFEYISIDAMEKMCDVLVRLIGDLAK